jgi:hypothetical protein
VSTVPSPSVLPVTSPRPLAAPPRPAPVVFAPSPLRATLVVPSPSPHGAVAGSSATRAPKSRRKATPPSGNEPSRSVALTRAEEQQRSTENGWR